MQCVFRLSCTRPDTRVPDLMQCVFRLSCTRPDACFHSFLYQSGCNVCLGFRVPDLMYVYSCSRVPNLMHVCSGFRVPDLTHVCSCSRVPDLMHVCSAFFSHGHGAYSTVCGSCLSLTICGACVSFLNQCWCICDFAHPVDACVTLPDA